jgi:NitT/TauT family transport system substrate-binding protein
MSHIRAGHWVAVLGVLTLLAAGCGSSSGSSHAGSGSGGTASGPELKDITVGTLDIPDGAALFIAIKNGYFKREGLTATPQIVQSSETSNEDMAAGTMDFSLCNYVSSFIADENGLPLRFTADALQAAPNVFDILVPKNSPIKTVADLKGKKIGAPTAKGAVGNLAIDQLLKEHGIPSSQVTTVPIAFPNMEEALGTGQVNAIWVTAPFITQIEKTLGATRLVDSMTGPLTGLSVAGWCTTQAFAQKDPKTVAAFTAAIQHGQQIAGANDDAAVRQILPTYTKISAQIAASMTLGVYPTSLSATRMQHVADLLYQIGFLPKKLNAASLILAEPSS